MSTITATWNNGQIVPDTAVNWPEGCRLIVEPTSEKSVGISEEDWPKTPDEIERHLELMDQFEPWLTNDEMLAWKRAIQEQNEFEKASCQRRLETIDKLFE